MAASVDDPTIQSKQPSRRALLGAALGGIAAWTASAIGRPYRVRATDGDAVTVGGSFTGTAPTTITNSSGDGIVGASDSVPGYGVYGKGNAGATGVVGTCGYESIAVSVTQNSGVFGASASGYGVRGRGFYGVYGTSLEAAGGDGRGVYGSSSSGEGVRGESVDLIGALGLATGASGATFGLFGRSNSPAGAGVGGRGFADSTGIIGYSGGGSFPSAKSKAGVYGMAAQDSSSKGVFGESPAGHGVHGKTTSGYAGYFEGKVYLSKFQEMPEISTPSAPGASKARLFVRDNGSNKTQLCVRFNTGAVKVLATQA